MRRAGGPHGSERARVPHQNVVRTAAAEARGPAAACGSRHAAGARIGAGRQCADRAEIGQQLEQLGYTTSVDVLRALATQAGVSYFSTFDVARVERGPVSMPAATVRALGLIPCEADDVMRRLSVICAAPVPKAAARALTRLTGWVPEVYLVSDGMFRTALDVYKPAGGTQASHQTLTFESLGAAEAHVADVAANERAVTMRHADCNAYRWVRVQGPQRVSDLLVSSVREERGCQAELTAH